MIIKLAPENPLNTNAGGTMNVTSGAPEVAPNQAPFQEKSMPESLKGQNVNLEEIESEVPNDVPKGEEAINKEGSEPVKVAKKDNNREEEVVAQPIAKSTIEKGKLSTLPETKKVEPVVPPIKAADTTTKVPEGQRDYSIFTPEEQKLVKAMNNQQFALVEKARKDVVAEKAKVAEQTAHIEKIRQGGLPDDWYNAQDSYMLHPDFRAAAQTQSKAAFEAEYYRNQLIAIEGGGKYRVINGYDKQGNPVFSEEFPATAEAKVNMSNFMQEAGRLANQYQGQMNQFAQGFNNYQKALYSKVDEIITSKFPWAKDPKDPRQERVTEFNNATPKEFHSHPSHKVAAHMWATIFDLAKQLDDANARAATGKTVAQIQAEVEPTVSSVASPDSGNTRSRGNGKFGPIKEFSLTDNVFAD